MRLVKYLERKYLDDLLTKGTIKIGTGSGYKSDCSGAMVADENEGRLVISGEARDVGPDMLQQMPLLAKFLVIGDNDKMEHIHFDGVSFLSPEFLVFCTSVEYNRDTHLKWFAEHNYDAAYYINDPDKFISLINQALIDTLGVKKLEKGLAEYYDLSKGLDIRDTRSVLPPHFFKNAVSYGEQKEYRFVWTGQNRTPEEGYIILNIEGLGKFIEPIPFDL